MKNRDFRISEESRQEIDFTSPLFESKKGIASFYREASELAYKYNSYKSSKSDSFKHVSAARLNAAAVLHMVYQTALSYLLEDRDDDFFTRRLSVVNTNKNLSDALKLFDNEYPTMLEEDKEEVESMRGFFIFQVLLDNQALVNATSPFLKPEGTIFPDSFKALSSILSSYEKEPFRDGSENTEDFFTFLTLPSRLFPDSLDDQIQYILRSWKDILPKELLRVLQNTLDYIKEEEKDHGIGLPPGPMPVADYSDLTNEYEAFSSDSNWMPRVVMMAKSTLVWLDQLSKKYNREIRTLDQIPNEELDLLKDRGFTALWLIGLWERSDASAEIKHLCGNPDAVASAYSLKDYDISWKIGGWQALENLRHRCFERGIRLASDMVPNHTGIDGNWVYEHPDYYISQDYPPFPNYSYNGPDLSKNSNWEVKIEDHYYDKTDAAVTFRLTDRRTGQVRYVFHGNDGTTMPWNDTAQLDYLNPTTREAVIQKIIHVAKNFPIIRFDAAMTLAKRHIERLWYPKPGSGGDIAGRASHAMDTAEFNRLIPEEFWREVVDRIAKEVPDTLLLAEAFWMMEGYFVRTLGMHRVYNSAFMNMLKNQENQKYRQSIKNTLAFEPEILKRYVNFMNNPDEDTAISQFGDGDRYFAVATLLATLPGLPMIGHGQIEGFYEKYGMEYQRAYYDEKPNDALIGEHYRRIFPLFRKRYLFSGVEDFNFYDCLDNDYVQESVYAYVNGAHGEKTLILVNNQYERTGGRITVSVPKLSKNGSERDQIATHIADDFNLHFSSKYYLVMDNFSDGLTYILPSINIFDNGYEFTLNGYEARVFLNIREVEDNDGCYEKLWNDYGNSGIKNINLAINAMRLEKLYKLFEPFKGKDFFRLIEEILKGKATKKEERQLLLLIAESYSKLYEAFPSFEETTKNLLQLGVRDVSPAPVVKAVQSLSEIFRKTDGKVFSSWAEQDNTLSLLIAMVLFLLPFNYDKTIKGEMEISDRLMLPYFFRDRIMGLGLSDGDAKALSHEAALFLGEIRLFSEKNSHKLDPMSEVKSVISDIGVMNLLKCNEYNGDVWFNKERMSSFILITTLAICIINPNADADGIYSFLSEKEIKSNYKLRVFLEPDDKNEAQTKVAKPSPVRNRKNTPSKSKALESKSKKSENVDEKAPKKTVKKK